MISTSALTITPSSTEPMPDPATVFNLDSLIPNVDTTMFDFTSPTRDSSLTRLLPPPKKVLFPYFISLLLLEE